VFTGHRTALRARSPGGGRAAFRHSPPGRQDPSVHRESRRSRDGVGAAWDDVPVQLTRLAWLVTVGICLIGAAMLFVAGYQGYGVLSICVGIAAAINLT
jgi:hypothetical protein